MDIIKTWHVYSSKFVCCIQYTNVFASRPIDRSSSSLQPCAHFGEPTLIMTIWLHSSQALREFSPTQSVGASSLIRRMCAV